MLFSFSSVRTTALASLLLIVGFLNSPIVNAQNVIEKASIDTVGGKIELKENQQGDNTWINYSVVFNGKEIIEANSQIKHLVDSYPKEGKARYVLVEIIGGSGCYIGYQIIEIDSTEKSFTSRLFEPCYRYFKFREKNGKAEIVFPRDSESGKIYSWAFSKGVLKGYINGSFDKNQ